MCGGCVCGGAKRVDVQGIVLHSLNTYIEYIYCIVFIDFRVENPVCQQHSNHIAIT